MGNITTYFKKINKDYTLITNFESAPSSDYILKLGEVVIYDSPDPNEPQRCKVGDGFKNWGELKWLVDISEVTASSSTTLDSVIGITKQGNLYTGSIPTVAAAGSIFNGKVNNDNNLEYIFTKAHQPAGFIPTENDEDSYTAEVSLSVSGPTVTATDTLGNSIAATVHIADSAAVDTGNLSPKSEIITILDDLNDEVTVDYTPLIKGSVQLSQNEGYANSQRSEISVDKTGLKDTKTFKLELNTPSISSTSTDDKLTVTCSASASMHADYEKVSNTTSNTKEFDFALPLVTNMDLGLNSTAEITLNAKDTAVAIKNGTIITATSDIDKIYRKYVGSSGSGDPYEGWLKWDEIPWSRISEENGGFTAQINEDAKSIEFLGGTEPLLIRLHMIVCAANVTNTSEVFPIDVNACISGHIDIAYDPMCDSCFPANDIQSIRKSAVTTRIASGDRYELSTYLYYHFDGHLNISLSN